MIIVDIDMTLKQDLANLLSFMSALGIALFEWANPILVDAMLLHARGGSEYAGRANNLFFGKLLPLHSFVPLSGRTPAPSGGNYGGRGQYCTRRRKLINKTTHA